jgi:glycosyltransferase involved in cell wall biosynthesis
MLRLAARLCQAFFCVSRAVEESWFGDSEVFDPDGPPSRRRHFTIYNGVDVKAFRSPGLAEQTRSLRHQLGLADRPVVTVVGRLRWEKGQATLVQAMSEVAREVPDAVLLVAGDGPDREVLGRQVAEAGLAGRTVWAGMRSAEQLPAFYGLSTVVAVPSVFEGFGLVAAEAMAAGTPVVASAVGGLREVVEDGVTGLLVPPGDAGALAAAVIRVLRDPALGEEMGQRGRDRVRALFSLERFEASTLAAYRRFGKLGGVAGAGR